MNPKYDHKNVAIGKNKKWIANRYFSTHNKTKKPFAMLLPPPNVTGQLHLGHAWDSYIQDTIIRYKKLAGFDVLWIPGMDHAGIATQAKVEMKLKVKHNKLKEEIGRDAFTRATWQWKTKYAARIRDQWAQLGLAFDYESERFTMDDLLSKAVTNVFIDLYKRQLIYRSKRAVNYDTKLKTVLSNIEVVGKDIKQKLYYIKYPLVSGGTIAIATVRPETMFADVALAVHPHDTRYKHLIGKEIIHPLLHCRQPIIADEAIEINKGTGVMKVSAHSIIDVEMIMKHNLAINECIDENGILNDQAGAFKGLDRFVARDKIIQKLTQAGQIAKIETKISNIGFSSRSNSVIEVLVKPQWFLKMKPMSRQIINDLKRNGVQFFPQRFEANLRQWMEDVHDWCLSRQLWWGHQIPVWYKNKEIKVQVNSPGQDWVQDDDVLDTWFSSSLAPFTFLGWPDNKSMLKRYYPTNLLVTGYDIIFFWVARMYFQGLDIMKQKPFQAVFVHGLIRDQNGAKMSKSLGNGIDPIAVIKQYGSDALRWFLLTNSKPGLDLKYSEQKVRTAWKINNKLWNIARYILKLMPPGETETSAADIWINNQLFKLKQAIDAKMAEYEFTIIGKKIYHFINEDLSSWYLEMTKNKPHRKFAVVILQKTLVLLHPFLPFITDHIYKLINGEELLAANDLPYQKMPQPQKLNRVLGITKMLRKYRTKSNISNKNVLGYNTDLELSEFEIQMINQLANSEQIANHDLLLPYGKNKLFIQQTNVNQALESTLLAKRITKLEAEVQRSLHILGNKNFITRAPQWKIDQEKKKLAQYQSELAQLNKK